jgi:molybdopterin-guanine dinucleotide biosynthesis protein A
MTNNLNRESLPLPVTGLILCGGKSQRMGRPKAFLPYQGTTMVAHVIATVRDLFNEVFLVANEPQLFEDLGCDIVKDILPYRGPLGGILSGLLVASNQYSFVLPCDMPFVNKRLIREMTMRRHGSDVLVLRHAAGIEPLIGIYSKGCVKPLEESLFAEEPSLHDFVSGLNAEAYFYDPKQEPGGPDVMPPYFNIDTPQDYSKAITRSLSGVHPFPLPPRR